MRVRCRKPCASKSFLIYLSALALFTVCNFIAVILIQRHIRSKNEDVALPMSDTINTEDQLLVDAGSGSIVIGDLLRNFPFHFNSSSYRADSTNRYFIHDFVVTGNAWTSESSLGSVTLATQCSVDRLDFLLDMAAFWRAPISVAIFVPGPDFYIAKVYIAYLRLCSSIIRTNVTFHFLYHRDMAFKDSASYPKHVVPSCSRLPETLPLLLRYRSSSFRRWWQQALHPQNHLRNVAKQGCLTEYHFLTDIDIIPMPGLARQLNVFLREDKQTLCEYCIYVVPTYEMSEKTPVPRTKSELVERVKKKQARPFHFKVFIHNQYATNHTLWESISDPDLLERAYKVNSYEFFYEPFYVAKSDVPKHDERFIGYGFTRNTQVFEMHLAGFEFWVLNPAFAIHKGMQNKRGRGAWRERQNIINRKQFLHFKREMALKYKSLNKKL